MAQGCGALGEAHTLGLIHRDIKPANIVLTERVDEPDVVKVVDFGLVKTLEQNDRDSRPMMIAGTRLASAAVLSAALLACEDAAATIRLRRLLGGAAAASELRTGPKANVSGSSATMAVDLRGRNEAAALAVG